MNELEFTPLESLQLIRTMIEKAKQGLYDKSVYFLLWGWGTFIACLSQYLLKVVFSYPYHYRVWLITFLIIFISRFISRRHHKKETVNTYINETMGILWLAVGICFFVLIAIFSKLGWENAYPFFMLLYGLGTFVSGKVLKFLPLIIGGGISWVLACTAIWFSFDNQMLFACAALLASYIIPGHILRAQYHNSKKEIFKSQSAL